MEGFLLAYTLVVGLVLIIGLASLIYSLKRILPYRKPLYWLAIPINVCLLAAFVGSALRRFNPPILLPPNTILFSFLLSLFLIGLLLIIVPYVDRLEARKISPTQIAEVMQTAEAEAIHAAEEAAHEDRRGD